MIKMRSVPTDNSDEVPDEGESNWYYFDSDGTAAYLNSKASQYEQSNYENRRKFLFLQLLMASARPD